MYKILIADDEGIVIDSLRYIIEKNFPGECEVESAKTGRSVVELAEWFRPDIALMDIHMGGINGIEAMKEIKKFSNLTIFIVISAYDKFDYAKEAINLGVLEYINKPMEQQRMVDTLRRAMSLIEEQRSKRSRELLIREKLETVIPIIENGFLNEILFREHFKEDVMKFKTLLGITQEFGYMIVFIFGDEQEGNYMTNAVGASVRVQSDDSKIREVIKEWLPGVIGSVMSNKIPVYIPSGKETLEYRERIDLIERCRNLSKTLENQFLVKFRIGIGGIYCMQDANKSYHDAVSALVQTTGRVAHVKDLPIGCDYEESYPVNLEKRLFYAVEQGDTILCHEMAQAYFQWMLEKYDSKTEDIKLKALEFVLWAEHIAYESGGMTYHFTSRSDYLPTINGIDDMEQLKQWFDDKMVEACRNITAKKKERFDSQIEKAKSFLHANYQRDISLDDVSMELDISPYYFSKLFKEETGENFIEYLTSIRIQKAKELLSDSNLSIREVCNEVGYQDPNYFSRLFKKNVGVTPSEYKENGV